MCSYKQVMWLSQHFFMYIKQCLCGSHDQHQVRVPSRRCRGDKTVSSSWLNAIFPVFDLLIGKKNKNKNKTPAGQGWSTVAQFQKCEVSYQLQKSTLNWLSNGTLVLWVLLWCSKQLKPLQLANPKHVKSNTGINFKPLEEETTIVCLWRSHCNIQLSVNGRDRRFFVPSPTVYHTILQSPHEKAIYKQWRLTVCTGLIKHIFWIKEKDINRFFFPSIMYKEEVLENDWAPRWVIV